MLHWGLLLPADTCNPVRFGGDCGQRTITVLGWKWNEWVQGGLR